MGAPYPVFLAIGGALLAFVPGAPSPTLPPDLVLALFVAPVLVDAAYDASLRDLRDNWAPLVGLVVFAVGLTTAAVAVVAHWLVPEMPWAAAVALGAIVAPPDAVAATAVLRTLRPPQRILTILEGESLLNDASALLIYRVAVSAATVSGFSLATVAPTFGLAVLGSLVAGPALGWLMQHLMERIQHIPTAIILQFVGTFTVWLLAEHVGLSGVLTTVCFAMTLARRRRRALRHASASRPTRCGPRLFSRSTSLHSSSSGCRSDRFWPTCRHRRCSTTCWWRPQCWRRSSWCESPGTWLSTRPCAGGTDASGSIRRVRC
jgi:CPA1 family monovalent cation:H+ antiporter